MIYIVKSGSVDISDYILDCSEVPAVQRNRDYVPVLGEITMIVSSKITSSTYVAAGATIKIANYSSQSYPFYIGIVSESRFDRGDSVHRVQIRSKLSLLQNFSVNYDTLHTIISAGATAQQYRSADNWGYPSVQLTWLIEKMFELVGIEINVPGPNLRIDKITFGGIERQIELQHLRLDENMLYAINQGTASNHNTIDADPEKRVLAPTLWEFFVLFCSGVGVVQDNQSLVGFNVIWSGSGTPESLTLTLRNETPITVGDDNNYGGGESNIVGAEGGYGYNVRFRSRSLYAGAPEYQLIDHNTYTVDSKNFIDHPTNFIIMYEKHWASPGDVVTDIAVWPLNAYPAAKLLYNKIQEAVGDFDVSTWNTNATLITRAKEDNINIGEATSEIVEELL